jgi:hypothetical protein
MRGRTGSRRVARIGGDVAKRNSVWGSRYGQKLESVRVEPKSLAKC